MSPATVDRWETTVDDYEDLRLTTPPGVLLIQLLSDFADIRQILSRRQPLDFQRRLYYVMARFAGMIGLTLVDHTDNRTETQAWFHTARLAAEETGDRILRAWVTVCESASYLWYERPAARAVQLAQAAQALAGQPGNRRPGMGICSGSARPGTTRVPPGSPDRRPLGGGRVRAPLARRGLHGRIRASIPT